MKIRRVINDYWEIILFNPLGLILGILAFKLTESKEIFLGLLGTGVSISFGLLKYKIENDRIFLELFTDFNKKYNSFFNDKLNIIINKEQIDKEDKAIGIDYINLCAEEYLWYYKSRIDYKVWSAWKDGMLFYFNSKNINPIVNEELNQKKSYYGLYEELGDKLIIIK